MRNLGWLAMGGLATWVITLYPGWLLGGEKALVQSTAALLICLAPALVTMWWALRVDAALEKQLLAVFGGTGLRLLVVLGIGCFLCLTLPEDFTESFWIWIAIFYLLLLALETTLLVRSKQSGPMS
jgi:hypothetical protein